MNFSGNSNTLRTVRRNGQTCVYTHAQSQKKKEKKRGQNITINVRILSKINGGR